MIENENPHLSQMARRPPKATGAQKSQEYEGRTIDWPTISAGLERVDKTALVWDTTPRMGHYRGLVKRLANLVGKIVLYLAQPVTKRQQESNSAVSKELQLLTEAVGVLDQRTSTTERQISEHSGVLRDVGGWMSTVRMRLDELEQGMNRLEQGITGHSTVLADVRRWMSGVGVRLDEIEPGMDRLEHQVLEHSTLMGDIRGWMSNFGLRLDEAEQAVNRLTMLDQRLADLLNRTAKMAEVEVTLEQRVTGTEKLLESLSATNQRFAALELGLREQSAHVQTLMTYSQRIDRLQEYVNKLTISVVEQEGRLRRVLEEARSRLPGPLPKEQLQAIANELESMEEAFYVRFEDRFRGTREDIKDRARTYLPIVRHAGAGTHEHPVLDIGCGRGEWIELLKEEQLEAMGIDLNGAMVDQCQALGLKATKADALEYLEKCKSRSLGAVTGFHIIEHLPFAVWTKLFDEALRVLKKDGIVIFETPNPSNVLVGSRNFYLDPTHRNPLPSDLVKFVAESRGFVRVEIMDLHPVKAEYLIRESSEVSRRFNEYFYGAQDYAVIAWKP